MEEQHQGRRYSQITETSSNSAKYASHSSQDDLLSDVSAERYRHGQLGLSAPSRSLGSGSGSDSHYYSDPAAAFPGATNMSGSQFPYGSGYESSGGTRQQTAGFGSYNTSMMMYSVPQANTQTSIYNTSSYAPSLASRNNPMASSSLLSATQDLGQPYFGADVGAVSTSTSLDQHPSHAQTNAYYQDISSSFHYTGNEGVGNASPGTGTSGLTGVESFYQLADLGANSAAMPESAGPDKAAELQEKWQDYQRRLTNVFQDITEGSLERAADGLLSVSFWLLSRVEELGKSLLLPLCSFLVTKLSPDVFSPYPTLLSLMESFLTQSCRPDRRRRHPTQRPPKTMARL